jgi:hypothetical protein
VKARLRRLLRKQSGQFHSEIGIDCPHHRGNQSGNVGVAGERVLFGTI